MSDIVPSLEIFIKKPLVIFYAGTINFVLCTVMARYISKIAKPYDKDKSAFENWKNLIFVLCAIMITQYLIGNTLELLPIFMKKTSTFSPYRIKATKGATIITASAYFMFLSPIVNSYKDMFDDYLKD